VQVNPEVRYEDDLKSPENLAPFVFSVILLLDLVDETIRSHCGHGPVECLRAMVSLPVRDAIFERAQGRVSQNDRADTGYLKLSSSNSNTEICSVCRRWQEQA